MGKYIGKKTEKKTLLIVSLERAASNLLVDKIKSIVALKMSQLVIILKDGFQ